VTTQHRRLDDEAEAHSRDFVRSLERGLAIIRCFGADTPTMTVSQLARRAGLTRAAARRFALTLEQLGYLNRTGDRFELSPRVLDLGYNYLSAHSFSDIALPRLERLVAETAEASEASILDHGDIVYLVRIPGPARMTISVSVGGRRPAHATAMGRALLADLSADEIADYLRDHELTAMQPGTITDRDAFLAELDKVRAQGFALVNQELEEGLLAIAVPVRDQRGRGRAAINLSTHIGRKSLADLLALVPVVQQAAADIEDGLRHSVNWAD
jgi:IclR family pca regulon transcriptional regulator